MKIRDKHRERTVTLLKMHRMSERMHCCKRSLVVSIISETLGEVGVVFSKTIPSK